MISPEAKGFLLDNPDLFITKYFGHVLGHPLEPFHLTLIEAATTQPKALVLFPAAHGKTTIISTLLPIWALCKDPNVRMALILKNNEDATNVMNAIIAELLVNDGLVRDFGPFKSEERETPFGVQKLTVVQRSRTHKSPTIAAFGSGSRQALGHRTDWTICDDIIHDKNSATPEARGKIREWFNQGPLTMAEDPDDRLTVVGTMFHPEDLYAELMALRNPDTEGFVWHAERFDAIVDEQTHETLWPKRWPWKRLMDQKANGTLDFNKRYRNRAVDPSRMVFRDEYVNGGYVKDTKYPGCLDDKYVVGRVQPGWPVFCGFDPAIGTYRDAKFCAHISVAVGTCPEHERCYWIVDLIRDQMTLPQQVELILGQHHKYAAFCSVIEANAYQKGLLDEVQRRMKDEGQPIKVEAHYTNRTNKPDSELGVASMSGVFENGMVHIPHANAESRRKMEIFRDELVQWPSGRTTDTVMAFWFAWRKAQQGFNRMRSVNRLHQGKSGPFWRQATKKRVLLNPYFEDMRT